MDPATASDSISQLIAGGGIAISGVLVLKLVELGTKMWTARNQKTDVGPQPFMVEDKTPPRYVLWIEFVTHQCETNEQFKLLTDKANADRRDLSAQIAAIGNKLDRNDEKAEERSVNLHRRIDPIAISASDANKSIDNHLQDHRARRPHSIEG